MASSLGMFDLITENNRKLLMHRYEDIHFIKDDIPSDLLCSRCRRVAIKHAVASCQHLYCAECLDRLYTTTYHVRGCIACGSILTSVFTVNAAIDLRICSLMARCPNAKLGCGMSATIMEIGAHISQCKYSGKVAGAAYPEFWSSKVANEIKLITGTRSEEIARRFSDFRGEIRQVLIEEFKKLDHNLDESNLERVAPTVMESPDSITRHMKLLEENAKTKKKLQENEDHKCKEAMDKMKLAYIEEKFNGHLRPLQCMIPQSSTAFTWVIDKVAEKMVKQEEVESPVFKLRNRLVTVQASCKFPAGRIGLQFQSPENQPEFSRPYPRVTYTLFNVVGLGHYERVDKVEEYYYGIAKKLESQKFDQYAIDFGADIISQSTLRNDTFTLFISLDFPHLIERPFSYDGVLVWRFEEFLHKFRHANRLWLERFYSSYFYSAPNGFRMKAEIHNNLLFSSQMGEMGMRKVPIFVHFVNGEFDGFISANTKVKISVALYNQQLLSMDPVDAVETSEPVCQLHLPPLELIQTYLWDDVLTIQITVKPVID